MDENRNNEIDLLELIRYLLRHVAIILICAVVLGAAAFVGVKVFKTPYYTASTRIYILNRSKNDTTTYSDLQSSDKLAADYEVLITGRNVTNTVISRLNLNMSDGALARKINVSNTDGTRILQISVTDTDPARAAAIANCVREVSQEQIMEIMEIDAVNLVYEATVPTAIAGPNAKKYALLGAVLGGMLAAAVLFIRFLTDDSMRTEEDVERFLGLNTLAMIPFNEKLPNTQAAAKRPAKRPAAKKRS